MAFERPDRQDSGAPSNLDWPAGFEHDEVAAEVSSLSSRGYS